MKKTDYRKKEDAGNPKHLDASNSDALSRKRFLSRSALALTAATLASQLPLHSSFARSRPPSDALGVGIIGYGARATALLGNLLNQRESLNLRFPVVCDVWSERQQEGANRIESETGHRPRTTSRYQDVLESEDVDCIVVATPDFSHTPILVDAARAGKHSYIEKPVSISVEQANQALEAVLEGGIVFQAGTQFRESPAYRGAAKALREGIIGDLIKIDCWYNRQEIGWANRDYSTVRREDVDWDQFLMHLPKRAFDPALLRQWQLYRDCTNGLLGLLGTHLFDIAAWLSDDPLPASVVGLEMDVLGGANEHADFQECLFQFPDGFLLNFSSRHGNSAPRTAMSLYGTHGTMNCPYSLTAEIVASGEGGYHPESLEEPVTIQHIEGVDMMENWVTCIRSGDTDTYADIHAAYAHSVTAALGMEAIRTGRKVHFSADHRQIVEG